MPNNNTVLGQYQDSNIINDTAKYTYFAWTLLSCTILAITIYSIQSNSKNKYEKAIILIICLVCIYEVVKWV